MSGQRLWSIKCLFFSEVLCYHNDCYFNTCFGKTPYYLCWRSLKIIEFVTCSKGCATFLLMVNNNNGCILQSFGVMATYWSKSRFWNIPLYHLTPSLWVVPILRTCWWTLHCKKWEKWEWVDYPSVKTVSYRSLVLTQYLGCEFDGQTEML